MAGSFLIILLWKKSWRRWYNIEVEYRDAETKQLRFTGDLSKYDSFESVIRMFEDTQKVKLKVRANRLIVERH